MSILSPIGAAGSKLVTCDKFEPSCFGAAEPDDMSFVFRRALKDPSGVPTARLICEAGTNFNPLGARIFVLTLTVRGAPEDPTVAAVFKLLRLGREVIVKEFAAITTDSAQEIWERVR